MQRERKGGEVTDIGTEEEDAARESEEGQHAEVEEVSEAGEHDVAAATAEWMSGY